MNFLTNFIQEHKVSDVFINYAKADILNEYICDLYFPLNLYGIKIKDLPIDYFKDAPIVKNNLSEKYREALVNKYIYHYSEYPNLNFKKIYNNIIETFSAETRGFLLSAMIGFYAIKQQQNYRLEFINAIKDSPKYVKDSYCLNYIKKCDDFYTLINQPFPEDVLSGTMLKSLEGNEVITLKKMLEKYDGKIIYLDFWASWCSPCRIDIAESHIAKQFLSEKNVLWVYISRDEDEKAWNNTSKKDGISKNQYLLENVKTSPLIKYLNINAIPRYIIMDTKHKIVESFAPRPNQENIDKLKQSILKYTTINKTITF
jgi:thiol-disulfide isomerase/thioredoxin